ncbi:LPS assembly protein LptD [uncultured Brevundimonas sp.]|uniref:LPS-assembly protein LptD n=1 Tax=uncultured Brevundimonas sp. TaxID=213418 RepID=UPI0030EE1BEA|tara:strand:- start:557 stop:3007 length:2451 start_codon:yes stop_codon:yes gene_type:complete
MQRDRSVLSKGALRLRLLASVATIACSSLAIADVALAQASSAPPSTTPGPDGLSPDGAYFDADILSREGDVITASSYQGGRVLARFRQHTLRAGTVTYDLAQGLASASDHAELVDPSGNVVYANLLELNSGLQAGVAVDFATRLTNGASLMAATAVRRSETVNELNYAIFTPCPLCDAEGNRKTPSISIQAEKVIQDEGLRAILYRNAIFRVGGVPVFYLPYFAHPDPTVERASGFLVPLINYADGRGLSYEQPYLVVVSPSEDWLISPQINSRVAPLLNLQWRRRFSDGTVIARGGYTYAKNFGDFDANNDGINDTLTPLAEEHRSYLLAHGRFDPDGPWRWGFTAERTSDKTLFDRYDILSPYQDNGLYYGDQRRLISQLYAERQTDRSYLSVAAFTLQSLRVSVPNQNAPGLNIFENDNQLPIVAPLIDARWEPSGPILGGRLRLHGSAVSLVRDAYVGGPVLRPEMIPPGPFTNLPGVDSRRISGQVEWRRVLTSLAGVRWEPFVDLRADAYWINDLPPMMGVDSDAITRNRATAGVDVSYPLIRRLGENTDLILEPLAQLSLSTDADLDPRIPNEDSQTLELAESSLFRIDRFPGQDLYEGGLRLTAGGRATLHWGESRQASLFVGRSLRANEEPAFLTPIPDAPAALYDPTGLAAKTSDWVVQGSFSPSDRVRGWGHATVDSSGDVRRAEASFEGRWSGRNAATISYIVDRSNPLNGPNNRNYEFIQLTGQQFIRGNWGVTVSGIADLEAGVITRSEVGLLFDDDCFRFELGFRRDNTRVRPSGPSEGLYIRLNLATFGGSGYGQSDRRW